MTWLAGDAPAPLVWDPTTCVLLAAGGTYGRMVRLGDGRLLASYELAGQSYVKDSADGQTWSAARLVASCPWGAAANPELLPLADGRVLLLINDRPRDGRHPFTIRVLASDDGGRSFAPLATVSEADSRAENGCWEPAAVQLPDGEIHLFFANESPYRTSAEQEISLCRSRDRGASWTPPTAIGFRAGRRDGMPVPLLLAAGGVVVAIEDQGEPGRKLQPALLHSPAGDWREGLVDGASPRRWWAVDPPLAPGIYAGAPYLRQRPAGDTVLACQSNEGGGETRVVVYRGNAAARGFGQPSEPFAGLATGPQRWPALCLKDTATVTVLANASVGGVRGVWAIDGRVGRE